MNQTTPPTISRRLRRPLARPPVPSDESSTPLAQGLIYRVRQCCLHFGRDRSVPVEYRPVLTIVKREQQWLVLPGTTQAQRNSPHFFHIPPDAEDCLLRGSERPEQYYFAGYEIIDLADCGAIDYGLLQQRLRITLTRWLADYWDSRAEK
ncbi:hypothetical protein FJZ55_04305 [Candidatus Woesearchaeota archaeon]|nr:hypothetical protein [Candidatus Woesearchaeota archaeon]